MLTHTSDLFSRIAFHAASMGMVFHFVSLTELFLSGQIVWASVHNGESLLAFLSMAFFMVIYILYKTTSPGASILYLLQERRLKAKKPTSLIAFLPALEVIDQIGYRSLLLGFPFMTLGLITGSVVAITAPAIGRVNFLDPKILLSVLMWAVYMVMVFTRWNSGWRGRRAAFLATFAFAAALAAWAANYFSAIHRFGA